jgi:L-alanine-DL-glutamate epimerase-like enolase superfamily enzyme
MKIASLDFYISNLDLKRPYTIAYKTVEYVENVIVVITLENGITGLGAANPSSYVVNDDVKSTFDALEEWDKDLLLKRDIGEFYHCLYQIHSTLHNHIGARAALDIALHDAFCQWLNKPLVEFLGRRITKLPTSITIGIKDVKDTLEEVKEYISRGFRFIKVKLGRSLEEDLERLIKLREKYGKKIHLRIDANQGYNKEELLRFYNRTMHLDLELIEQPLPVKDTGQLKELPLNIRELIAADESLVHAKDAFRLAVPPISCGIFNIKLMKCGGIVSAQQIATVAAITGRDLMWGCNDESTISISAALHTAFSHPHTRYLDLDGSFDLIKDVVEEAFILDNGIMTVTGRPGLGWKRRL